MTRLDEIEQVYRHIANTRNMLIYYHLLGDFNELLNELKGGIEL